jgi:post-segregation antitoxin (ccd killing protein)
MQVTVNVSDELARAARARGVAVEAYVEEVLSRESRHSAPNDSQVVGEAINRLMELRKGNTLGGFKIKDLINEGRKS